MELGIDPWKGNGSSVHGGTIHEDGLMWNDCPVILKYMEIRDELRPYLDDFAQLRGTRLRIISYDCRKVASAAEAGRPSLVRGRGALCAAACESDRETVSIVIEKNCRAALAAIGRSPLSYPETLFMRQFYLRKYSGRADEKKEKQAGR